MPPVPLPDPPLAERAGFTREGMLRRYRTRHGVCQDLVMFSLLPADQAS